MTAQATISASTLRTGDSFIQRLGSIVREVIVLKTKNTPEHVRLVTTRGDVIMNPGHKVVAIRKA